jgi:putative Mn2+ efflux pump MntP
MKLVAGSRIICRQPNSSSQFFFETSLVLIFDLPYTRFALIRPDQFYGYLNVGSRTGSYRTVDIFEIIFIALALSIDAFAVALAASATGRINGARAAGRLAFHFGLFQFLMPVLGWAAGAAFEPYIKSFDHWIAFILLCGVALHMIRSGMNPDRVSLADDPSRGLSLVMLSMAVSIDALAVGLTLAVLNTRILLPTIIIGIVAATVSLAGIFLGNRLHSRFGRIAEIFGGVILIFIATRILLTHLFGT